MTMKPMRDQSMKKNKTFIVKPGNTTAYLQELTNAIYANDPQAISDASRQFTDYIGTLEEIVLNGRTELEIENLLEKRRPNTDKYGMVDWYDLRNANMKEVPHDRLPIEEEHTYRKSLREDIELFRETIKTKSITYIPPEKVREGMLDIDNILIDIIGDRTELEIRADADLVELIEIWKTANHELHTLVEDLRAIQINTSFPKPSNPNIKGFGTSKSTLIS